MGLRDEAPRPNKKGGLHGAKTHKIQNFWITEEEFEGLDIIRKSLIKAGHMASAELIEGILERITERR